VEEKDKKHPLEKGEGTVHYSENDPNVLANQIKAQALAHDPYLNEDGEVIVRAQAYPADLPAWKSHSGTIPYSESASAQIEYIIPENDLATMISATLGMAHPIWTDLICLSIDFSHDGSWECDGSDWAHYVTTANFGPPEEDDSDLGQESLSVNGQIFSVPTKALEWSSPGDTMNEAAGDPPMTSVVVPQAELRIKFTKVASLPKASLVAAVGKVNSDAWRGFGIETVMFNGVESEVKYTTGGQEYTVGYSYSVNFNGWNKRFRPSAAVANKWEEIEPNPYDKVSFAATFGF